MARKPRATKKRSAAPREAGLDGSTAARILRAAEELLGERGYDGVSMRDVALRAGINKALIFYHFGSKDELYEAVLDRYYGAHAETLSAAFMPEGKFAERVHRLIDAYFDFIDAHRSYPRLVQLELARGGPHLEKIARSLHLLYQWATATLEGIVPPEGAISARELFLSFSGMVIHYFTYAPVLEGLWGGDPLAEAAKAERREHLHWMVDAVLAKLLAGGKSAQ